MVRDRGRYASLGELAYDRLREEIRNAQLTPGVRVREVSIAERLGISRTPVREALRRLVADGLLVFEPNRGMVVAELDRQAVAELYEMRASLEATAAALAARHARVAEVDALKSLLDIEARLPDEPVALADLNRRFHAALYDAAHNRYLVKSLQALSDSMALLGPTTLALPGRRRTAHGEHREIIDAIEARNAEAAHAAAEHHIRQAHRRRLDVLFPESLPAAE